MVGWGVVISFGVTSLTFVIHNKFVELWLRFKDGMILVMNVLRMLVSR